MTKATIEVSHNQNQINRHSHLHPYFDFVVQISQSIDKLGIYL